MNDSDINERQRLTQRLLSFSDHDAYGAAFNTYFVALKRGKFWVLGIWLALTVWGGATGFRYIREARDEMNAPDGSRGAFDAAAFQREFQQLSTATQMILLVSCIRDETDCMVTCKKGAKSKKGKECEGFNKDIETFSFDVRDAILAKSDEFQAGYTNDTLGYYLLADRKMDLIKSQFASKDGRATFLVFTGSEKVKSENRYKLVEEISKKGGILDKLNPDHTKYSMGITGVDPMTRDGSTAAVEQSERIDMVTMPIAFALLAYMVRSFRLLLISLVNMGITILTALGFLTVLTDATGKPPMTTTASFVEVLGLSMCIDASLFFLRRFRDESKNGREPELAIKIMMSQSGHVVLMSSLTIIFVFAGFLFMKSTDLMVQGLACVVTVSCSLLVNVTNTPALLLMFPDFFAVFNHVPGEPEPDFFVQTFRDIKSSCKRFFNWARRCCSKKRHDTGDYESLEEELEENGEDLVPMQTPASSPEVEMLRQRGGPYKGWYFKVLMFITRWPWNLVCLVSLYVLVIPLALQALQLKRNENIMLAIPRDAESSKIFRELMTDFSESAGTLSPMYVMVQGPPSENSLLDPRYRWDMYQSIRRLEKEIAEATGIPSSSMRSIAAVPLPFLSKMLINDHSLLCKVFGEVCEVYQFLWNSSVNEHGNCTIISITVPFDPFSERIETFVGQVFQVTERFRLSLTEDSPVKDVNFAGISVSMVEDMRISFDQFPLLVAVTCVVVFLLIAAMLQSAFVLVRLTMTVVLPLAAMFGLSVLVYQKGILNWTGIAQLESNSQGFFWYVPLLCFTLTVGLALDYDVLVISRIREHRFAGMEIRAAILRSMWEINSTLVAAGLIMTLAFGSLLISDTAAVNQMSFILTSSVLFDTFVIQTFVVPCIMSFADHLAWWPVHPPMQGLLSLEEEIKSRNDFYDELALDS